MKVNMRRALRLNRFIVFFVFIFGSLFAQSKFQNGLLEFNNGNFEKAASIFEENLKTNPYDIQALQYLVNSYLQLEQNNKAILALENGIKNFPNQYELKLVLAKLYLNKQEFNKAESILLELAQTDYQIDEVKDLLGKLYFNDAVIKTQNGDNWGALKKIDKAEEYGFNSAEFYGLKAQILIELKKKKSAIIVVNNGLNKFPKSEILLTSKAVLLIDEKKYDEAIKILNPLWKKDKGNLQIGMQLAMLYRAIHEIDKAFNVYNTMLKIHPKERRIYDEMISYLRLTKKHSKERELYEEMKKVFPKDNKLDYKIAKTYVEEGDDSTAIAKLVDFIEQNGIGDSTAIELADLYKATNQVDKAIEVLNNAIDKNKKSEKVFLYLGKLYFEKDDYESAEKVYQKYLSDYPISYLPYLKLGKLYNYRGMHKEAEVILKDGLKINKKNPYLLFELAKVSKYLSDNKIIKNNYAKAFKYGIYSLEEEQQIVKTKVSATNNMAMLNDGGIISESSVDTLKSIIEKSFYYLLNKSSDTEMHSLLSPLLNGYKRSAILLFYKGEIYFNSHDYNNAKKYFNRALKSNSKFEAAHLRLAEIYLKENKINKAILSYKRALGINPKLSKAYKELINLYREKGELSQLCDEWLMVYSANPNNKLLEENLIVALHKAGRIAEAKEIIKNSE